MRDPHDKWITTPLPNWYQPLMSSGQPIPPETLKKLFPGLYEAFDSTVEAQKVKGKGKKKKGC